VFLLGAEADGAESCCPLYVLCDTSGVLLIPKLAFLLALFTAPCALRAADRTNLVFILADDLGWSDTTLYDTTSFYETPNIKRLARRGMLFTNAYTAHPLCSPTRCSIMTGLDPARTGFTSAAGHVANVILEKSLPERARPDQKVITPRSVSRLDTKYVTLAETIKAARYVTGHFGKWDLGKEPYSPRQHGFDAVGQLLDTLDRLKLSEKTIVVFFSDNGGNMHSRIDGLPLTSNAPLRGGKSTIYEGGTRVPCAVVWSGRTKPGSKTDALLSSSDWYTTLLDMMQITKPANLRFNGGSQTPTLLGQRGPRESLVCFVPNYFPQPGTIPSTYVRRGDWKLIRFHGDGANGSDRLELYNLAKDIGESKNVAAANQELVKQLDAEIDACLAKTKAAVPVKNSAYDPKAKVATGTPKRNNKRPDPATFFKRRDANGDGFVTLKEYIGNPKGRNVPALTRQLNKRDANKDGKLSLQELKTK
jgi:arylsulfatase A-like enzyme